MIKKITLLVLIILLVFYHLRADEGMWIPTLLDKYNISEMQSKGFKLTAEDIYSINKASMKDAVVMFGGGCKMCRLVRIFAFINKILNLHFNDIIIL